MVVTIHWTHHGGISDKALKSGYAENKYRFSGQLYDDDLGWNVYQMKYRSMDSQMGRFWQIGPLATKYAYNSTYAYAENRVTNGIDLEGAECFQSNASGLTAIAHAVSPNTITDEAVKATQQAELKANQINAKALPVFAIGFIGFVQPEVGGVGGLDFREL